MTYVFETNKLNFYFSSQAYLNKFIDFAKHLNDLDYENELLAYRYFLIEKKGKKITDKKNYDVTNMYYEHIHGQGNPK